MASVNTKTSVLNFRKDERKKYFRDCEQKATERRGLDQIREKKEIQEIWPRDYVDFMLCERLAQADGVSLPHIMTIGRYSANTARETGTVR